MSHKNTYRLINPVIGGSIDTVVKSRSSLGAAKKIYNSMSKYFNNHVKNFYITLQNVDTKKLNHFKIDEKMKDSMGADGIFDVYYNVVETDDNFPNDINKKLVEYVDKDQAGGDDSSSSSSSSSDYSAFKMPLRPINALTYYILPYHKLKFIGMNPLDTMRTLVPMFNLPLNPQFEIVFDLYRL